jgi:hypothetical protein
MVDARRCARGYGLFRGYAAVRAEALSSISFSWASFVHRCALQRRNLRSPSSFVRAAYRSHWRACSKHSATVGDMTRSPHTCHVDVVREHYRYVAGSLMFGKTSIGRSLRGIPSLSQVVCEEFCSSRGSWRVTTLPLLSHRMTILSGSS